MDWSDGVVFTVGLVRYARSAKRDGLDLPMMNKFADLGTERFGGVGRDMKTLLRDAGVYANITALDGPLFKQCILPSTVVRLIARSETQFKMRLAPSTTEMQLFWEQFFSSESGMAYKAVHPHLRTMTTAQLASRFAIRVHEDAAPYTKNYSMDCISWSSLHGRGKEMEVKYQTISSKVRFVFERFKTY